MDNYKYFSDQRNGHSHYRGADQHNQAELVAVALEVGQRLFGRPSSLSESEARWGNKGSKKLDRNQGLFSDFEAGVHGGVIAMVVHGLECSKADAWEWLGREFGMGQTGHVRGSPGRGAATGTTADAKTRKTPDHGRTWVNPIPDHDGPPLPSGLQRQVDRASQRCAYRNADGTVAFAQLRFDNPDGSKRFMCLTLWRYPDDRYEWDTCDPPQPFPLYRLNILADHASAPVLIVEGELKCDRAAKALGTAVVVSTKGGASRAHQTDFEPLAGRDVIIWRDNDDPGVKYQTAVASKCWRAGARSVSAIDLDLLCEKLGRGKPLPPKWDVADVIKEGLPVTDEMIEACAIVFDPPPEPSPETGDDWLSHPAIPLVAWVRSVSAPYPIDALPDLMRGVVEALQPRLQVPAAMLGNAALTAAAHAAQGHANVRRPEGPKHGGPISLWCITVAKSGDRKTEVDKTLLGPIEALQAKWQADDAARKSDDDQSKPKGRQFIATEFTVEGLAQVFARNRPVLGVFADEGGQVTGGHSMRKEAKAHAASSLSKYWDGGPVRRNLADGSRNVYLPDVRLTMHLQLQPNLAEELVGDPLLIEQGLLARFLMAWPETLQGTRQIELGRYDRPPEDEPAVQAFVARLLALHQRPLPYPPDRTDRLGPPVLECSAKAAKLFETFYNEVEGKLELGTGEYAPIASAAAKAGEQALRIAAVMTVLSGRLDGRRFAQHELAPDAIAPDTMERAIELVRWYLNEALRIAAEESERRFVTLCIAAYDYLKNKARDAADAGRPPILTSSVLTNGGPNPIRRDKDVLLRVLERLEEHGLIHKVGEGYKGLPRFEVRLKTM